MVMLGRRGRVQTGGHFRSWTRADLQEQFPHPILLYLSVPPQHLSMLLHSRHAKASLLSAPYCCGPVYVWHALLGSKYSVFWPRAKWRYTFKHKGKQCQKHERGWM